MRRPSEDITEKIINLKLIAIKFTKLCQFIQLIIFLSHYPEIRTASSLFYYEILELIYIVTV